MRHNSWRLGNFLVETKVKSPNVQQGAIFKIYIRFRWPGNNDTKSLWFLSYLATISGQQVS